MKIYIVMEFGSGPVCACEALNDAEEMILSLMDEYYYLQFYVTCQNTGTVPIETCLGYAANLYYKSEYYWIEEVNFFNEDLG